jgi:tetratricopeptide (TPR) repeat protein
LVRRPVRALAAVSRFPHLAGAVLIAALAGALYSPFLANPPVFDDLYFLWGQNFAYYATHPFGLELRVPPYFSMAVVQLAWWGHIEAHRILTLAFHIACALGLYKLVFDLQRYAALRNPAAPATGVEAHLPALVAAAVFAVHPVAVYGAGYLIQRTTLFATLFSLISIVLYLRGLARRNHADAVLAAMMYSIAVLSKETAVMLPAAAVIAGLIVEIERRFLLRHAALYAACCAPAALLVTVLVKMKVGAAYEPDFEIVSAQAAQAGGTAAAFGSPWLESAVTQAGLFFRYLALWLVPDTGAMSFDWRTEFAGRWPPAVAALGVTGYAGYGLLGAWLVARGGALRVAGFGLLFPWILFFTEFATVRFQEPFVLYRSYLWAPGLMVVFALALARLPVRAVAAFALLAVPLLGYQAHDRLQTFASGLALWEDAVAKLPLQAAPGGSRTLYYLSREYLSVGRAERAAEIAERCLTEYPATYDCHYARARIQVRQGQVREALPHLVSAVALRPERGEARHKLGLALEHRGCIEEAKDQYRRAARLRSDEARESLDRLEKRSPAPAKPKRVPEVCGRGFP